MSDNELTISDYYDEYPIMRYILPGLIHNSGAAPHKNISNNAFILRQGAWVLSKILDDEHTEYGYETFHPAQRYLAGENDGRVRLSNADKNELRLKTMSMLNTYITNHSTGLREVRPGNTNAGDYNGGNMRDALNVIVNDMLYYADTTNPAYRARDHVAEAITDNGHVNYIGFPIMPTLNGTPHQVNARQFNYQSIVKGAGVMTLEEKSDLEQILRAVLTVAIRVYVSLSKSDLINEITLAIIETIKIALSVSGMGDCVNGRTLDGIANQANSPARFAGIDADFMIQTILNPNNVFRAYEEGFATAANVYQGLVGSRNHRKNSFFHHLTDATAPNLATPIGLYTTQDGGSFIVPYTDYEERSISTGGNLIDNRDLLPGVPAGAEPRMANVTDRIRNGRKGDHIATVLTPDDVRLLAIFLQLAEENFNAPAAMALFNSRNDVVYRRHNTGVRRNAHIESYFDHLIALRETDHTVRRGSGLNQGKVEALSVLAGLRYAIQGPIFPVLSQTVFHLVAHYFVRLVVHDSRAQDGAAADMNFHNNDIYNAGGNHFMRFLGGNGTNLQLIDRLGDQVNITTAPAVGTPFGCPGDFHGLPNVADRPFSVPVHNNVYDHPEQILKFIRLIQSFIAPGNVNAANPASTTFERTGNAGQLHNTATGQADAFDSTYNIIKKAHDDIRTFVIGTPFNYGALNNDDAGAGDAEPVFHAFAGSLEFHGHSQLSNINLSTVEPTLFDADIRHLLKFNVTDRAIKVLGNEIHIIGTSTQNSFTGALVGPTQKLGNGGQFIINDYGVLEYQEIINGQVVQTDNSELYNKMIGNNDYCKVFGSSKFGDPRDRQNVCNTMISACSIIGNYGNPKKCTAAFRQIDDGSVSKNLRGWNALNKNLTQLNAYKILTGLGFNTVSNTDGDITFKDENNSYTLTDQEIFDKLELSAGVAPPPGGGAAPAINSTTSHHVKYVKKLMDTVGIIKITKIQQTKTKDNIPTLQLPSFTPMARIAAVRLGMHSYQSGGNESTRELNILYGGNECNLQMIRKNIERLKEDAKKNGIVIKKNDELKLNQIMSNLEINQKALTDIQVYIEASRTLRGKYGRNALNSELKIKMDELKDKINKGYNKIEKAKQIIQRTYLVGFMD